MHDSNYKIKKRIHKDEADWIRVEDMHDAIIPKSEFDLVQEILLKDTRGVKPIHSILNIIVEPIEKVKKKL